MPIDVIDLDLLRPEPRIVHLGGNDIDVSFIPCAITFDLQEIIDEIAKLTAAELKEGGSVARHGFELTVKMCSLFCARKYPEMTEEWFYDNTDPGQLGVFADAIKTALFKSYEGIEEYQKNPPTARRKKTT